MKVLKIIEIIRKINIFNISLFIEKKFFKHGKCKKIFNKKLTLNYL